MADTDGILHINLKGDTGAGFLFKFSDFGNGLKDAAAQVRCALFRGKRNRMRYQPKQGDEVLVRTRISLYEARGDFQLIVEHMEPAGEGALRQALEALKQKLATEGLFALDADDPFNREFWRRVIGVRESVGKAMESFRAAGNSSLDAELALYCDDALKVQLDRLEDELRFVLITSDVKLYPLADKPADAVETDDPALAVVVSASPHAKCVRCWHHREDVGADSQHPELCGRCVENVAGEGEGRRFA